MDLRFRLSSSMIVAGPSRSGKTTLIKDILAKPEFYFDEKINNISWYYGQIAPTNLSINIVVREGLPKCDDIIEKSIIVLDDLFLESTSSDDVTNLFSRVAHHKNCFIIFITQNIFHQSKHNRTRSINTHYLVLFKNPRDKLQVINLQRQMGAPFLVAAFDDATKEKPHGYILLDFHQDTHENLRVRTGILLGDEYYVYINNSKLVHDYKC